MAFASVRPSTRAGRCRVHRLWACGIAASAVGCAQPLQPRDGGPTATFQWADWADSSEYEIVDLGTLGGAKSAATGINNQGHVIGWSAVGPDFSHAFVWDGAMRDLGTVGDGRAEVVPNAINARGQIVGYESDFPNILRAVMWDSGVLRDLGTLGDQELPVAIASAVSDAGQVVGASQTAGGPLHAFLWRDGAMT
ncbi:MAG: hypothetical protein DMD45_16670, partial [Gemmatimonadetes bacterium]